MKLATISDATNAKLGRLIHSWSLPAGKRFSCPGESGLCRTRCYAKHGHFHQTNVKDAYARNFSFSQTDEFADWMVGALRACFAQVMRPHVSGDFYSVEYVRKWHYVVSWLKRIQFFAYTRSWREEEQLPELVKLAALPNFQMWWSIDRETGPAPLIRGIRRAYMAIDDVDADLAPDDCDLVFRAQRATVMKKANGILVCPPENGVTTQSKITCSNCGICWDKRHTAVPRWEASILPYLDATGVEINAV